MAREFKPRRQRGSSSRERATREDSCACEMPDEGNTHSPEARVQVFEVGGYRRQDNLRQLQEWMLVSSEAAAVIEECLLMAIRFPVSLYDFHMDFFHSYKGDYGKS